MGKVSSEITTIKIHKKTKSRLDRLREHERETYDQIIRKILYILNLSRSKPEKVQKILKKIEATIKLNQKKYTEEYFV